MKKSQITMVIIVGMVLFIMVGLLLYLSKYKITSKSQKEAQNVEETLANSLALKDYVQQCLEKTAKDGIISIGMQGGYLYSSQKGPQIDYDDSDLGVMYIDYKGNKVSYNIQPFRRIAGTYSFLAPDYPWKYFPYQSPTATAEVFNGIFGTITMPPLTKENGPNSIQSQLETYSENNVKECVKLENFRNQGLVIFAENPNVQVVIGASDVSFSLSYPITSTSASGETSFLKEFSANVNVRTKDLYLFSKELIDKDTNDIKFDISSPNNNKDDFSVSVFKNVMNYDDIIEVTDEISSINGRQLQYIFARKNRMPALHYIRPDNIQFENGTLVLPIDVLSGNAAVYSDPDEDASALKIFTPFGDELTDGNPFEFLIEEGNFRIEVSDGQFSDYQQITARRKAP